MNTILLVLAAIALAFFITGAVSMIVENKLTEMFEFYTEFNGWIITTLAAFNSLLLTFATALNMLGSTQVLILIPYTLFSLANIAGSIYKFKKA